MRLLLILVTGMVITFTSCIGSKKTIIKAGETTITLDKNSKAIVTRSASITIDSLPGNTSLPSSKAALDKLASFEKGEFKYSVEDYFKNPSQRSFKLSPDGLYLSYMEKDGKGKSHLYIKNTATNIVTKVLEEKDQLILSHFWVNKNKILFIQDGNGDENYHVYSVNIDGSDIRDLTPFEGVTLSTIHVVKNLNCIIVPLNKNNPQIFEPYKINFNTGEYKLVFENKDVSDPIDSYKFDKDGILRGYTKQQNGTEYTFFYRSDENSNFQKIITTTWKDKFKLLKFNYATDYPHDAFIMSNMESNTNEIILYDLKAKKTIKKIYSNPTFDVGKVSFSKKRHYELDYISYIGEKKVIIPMSEKHKELHEKIIKKFKGFNYKIISKTDEEDKLLIYVTSDKLYGVYYLFDVNKNQFKEVFNLMPELSPNEMAEMRLIKFTTRDGLLIYGYLTIPKQVGNGKFPLIVNPHGGPYDERDSWGFNPEVQLFASRGYATLQINYRGSGGYGKKFMMAGNKQIGRKMLDDLEDAVSYVKTLGLIDEDKIAIYGASYGGLATLGSLVKTPDLYKCGIDEIGVSNLFTFFKSFPPYWKPYLRQVYEQWYDENSVEDQKIMTKVSPALNVYKIKKPLFVIQGANDPRVNINESDQIVKNLRERGFEVPYMVKYNEGHGFKREKNKIEMYKVMMGFFAKHLK